MECPICAQMTPAGPETNGICDECMLRHRPTFVSPNSGQKHVDIEEITAHARSDEHLKVARHWLGRLRRERAARAWHSVQHWMLLCCMEATSDQAQNTVYWLARSAKES